MSSGATAQDSTWKAKEQGDENRYAREREQEQIAAIRERITSTEEAALETSAADSVARRRDDIEGGYGGQEDLEDRYATTSGEH